MLSGVTASRKVLKVLPRLSGLVVCLGLSTGLWADTSRGKAIYDNHCMACHDKRVHMRDGRIASKEILQAWVESWGVHSNPEWGVEETYDVVEYLNALFYQFD